MKKALIILAVAVFSGVYHAHAQVYVTVRPPVPHHVRVVAPSPRHVWIDEDWEPRGGAYVFIGGRWAEPPHPGWRWVPGHWKRGPHGDWWVPGHWKHRR